MFQYDVRNSGRSARDDRPRGVPSELWRFETDGQIWGSPVVQNGLVYIASYDRNLYALDAETGELEWQFETEDRIDGTPAVHDGTVYFGSFDRKVYALDAETGDREWEFDALGFVRSSPTVVGDVLYIGGSCHNTECEFYYDDEEHEHGYVYALDRETGDQLWQYQTDDGVMSTPAVADGTVYIGSSDERVYAIDADTGDKEWDFEADDMVMSSPSIADGTVYVASNDAYLYALDATTGDQEWVFDTAGAYVSGSPSLDDGTVYIGSSGVQAEDEEGVFVPRGILYAVSADSGEEVWSFQTEAIEIGSTPAIVNGVIFVGSHSNNEHHGGLYAVDPTGHQRWEHETGGEGVGSSPAIVDEVVYFGAADGNVYALA